MKTPEALTPIYRTESPGNPVILYRGEIDVLEPGNSGEPLRGRGTVALEWTPFADIRFEYERPDEVLPSIGRCALQLVDPPRRL
jgi:hypothetical protein